MFRPDPPRTFNRVSGDNMIKKNLGFGIFFVALGGVCIPVALSLGIGTDASGVPLEGFVPFIMCIAIIVCGALILVQAVRAMNGKLPEEKIPQNPPEIAAMNAEDQKQNLPVMLLTFGGMVALLLVWRLVDFYLAIALFSVAINKFVFKMTWVYTVIFTLVIVAALYFGFGMGFQVRFNAV